MNRSTKKSRASARRAWKLAAASGKSGRPRWRCPACGGTVRISSSGVRRCAACSPKKQRGRKKDKKEQKSV